MINFEPLIQQILLFTQTQNRTNQLLDQILSEIKNQKK